MATNEAIGAPGHRLLSSEASGLGAPRRSGSARGSGEGSTASAATVAALARRHLGGSSGSWLSGEVSWRRRPQRLHSTAQGQRHQGSVPRPPEP